MRGLKVVLIALGVLCLVGTAPGVFAPWSSVTHYLRLLGLEIPEEYPFVVYSFRLACLGFALIGVFFFVLATDPARYRPMLVLTVCGLLVTAAVALVTGRLVQMRPPWYWLDVAICLIAGVLILALWPRERDAASE
jgi:hypothetical protein